MLRSQIEGTGAEHAGGFMQATQVEFTLSGGQAAGNANGCGKPVQHAQHRLKCNPGGMAGVEQIK